MAMAQDRTAVLTCISTLVLFSLVAVGVSVAVDLYAFEQPIYRVVEGTDSVAVVFIVRTGLHWPESSSVDVATSDGAITGRSAMVGTDYTAVSTTVTFTTAGDNRAAVSVPIIDNTIDNTDEDIHCFTLTLSNPNPSDGILGSPALVCIIDNDNFFLGTCPPPQAVIESNGEPVIEAIAPTGSTMAIVSWTDPTPGANLLVTYQCFSGTSTSIMPCMNGGNFPISSTFSDYNGRILVQYTASTSFLPTVVIHSCDFYIRVHDDPSLHLTMVTPTPYGAGSLSAASISCFRSPPDTSSPLSFGRPFQVRLPELTIQTSTSLPAGSFSLKNGAAITQHLTTSIDAVGLFYCEAINRGLTTQVYSIIHNIQRFFEPADGLVTKTVNIGESVTLSVTGVNNPPHGASHAPLWRQISNGVVVMEGSGTEFTLIASTVNDGDLFAVIQSAANLGDNHFSMIRLIVRGCAAGKWGPPGCVGVCDQCYNRGVCDDETGKCICPPGFMGTNCLTACGMHRFGWNCELQCGPGNIIQSCTGSQFGLPDPYGNSCISGYMGRDCNIACEPGMFGAGCTQMCRCQQGASCDRFTGECPINSCVTPPCLNGGVCQIQGSTFVCLCSEGYSGNTCQIDDPCVPSPCLNGGACQRQGSTFACLCSEGYSGNTCEIDDPCVPSPCLNGGACQRQGSTFACLCSEGYSGYTCGIDDPCVPSPCLNGGACQRQVSTFVCLCSHGYSGYTCEIDDPCVPPPCLNGGTCQRQVSIFVCLCSEGYSGNTCEIDDPCVPSPCLNGGICQTQGSTFVCQCSPGLFGKTCGALAPSLSQAPTVTGTSTSATVSWLAWGSIPMDTGEGPVTAYKVYYLLMTSPPDSWIEAGNVSVTDQTQSMYMLTVGQLQPDTEYLFSVAAVGTGGAEGPQSPSASYVTLSLPIPTGSPIGLTTVIPPMATQVNPCVPSPCLNGGTCFISVQGSTFLCRCSDGYSGNTCKIDSAPLNTSPSPAVIVVICVVVVMVIVAVLLLIIYRLRQRRQNITATAKPQSTTETRHEMIEYSNDINVADEAPSTDYERVGGDHLVSIQRDTAEVTPTYEDIGLPSWAQAWSITWDDMFIGNKILGKGYFGEVTNGVVVIRDKDCKAAIKKLKVEASPVNRKNFMDEFQLLTQVGRHPNIVGLLGACQHQDILYVALEYLPNGDLRSYLRKARCAEDESQTDLCSSKLMQFAHDVAKGMQHLAALGVIHRDLAARNILLDTNLVAKVSDFGLSRGEDIYVQTSKTRVPTRWLSIESIAKQVYTSKSDVWSYGVLLWEIASLGATPYEGIKTQNLLSRLENGYRMPKPSNCDQEIYNLMLECWQDKPNDRPSFKKLATSLQTLATCSNQTESPYMWLLPMAENYRYMNVCPELDDN